MFKGIRNWHDVDHPPKIHGRYRIKPSIIFHYHEGLTPYFAVSVKEDHNGEVISLDGTIMMEPWETYHDALAKAIAMVGHLKASLNENNSMMFEQWELQQQSDKLTAEEHSKAEKRRNAVEGAKRDVQWVLDGVGDVRYWIDKPFFVTQMH